MVRSSVAVERAVASEIDEVVALCQAARSESPLSAHLCDPDAAVVTGQVLALLDLADAHVLVAKRQGAVAGACIAEVMRPGLFSDVTWIQLQLLYVQPAHRRKGVGQALLSSVAALASAEGAARLASLPLTGSRSEQRFYARFGFTAAGSRRVVDLAILARRMEARRPEASRRRIDELVVRRRRSRKAASPGVVDSLAFGPLVKQDARQPAAGDHPS